MTINDIPTVKDLHDKISLASCPAEVAIVLEEWLEVYQQFAYSQYEGQNEAAY